MKFIRPKHVGLIAAALLTAVGYHLASGQETAEAYQMSRSAQAGRSISPVPLNLRGKRPQLIYLGSYLVNAHGGCNDCHTCPSYRGGDPYKIGGQSLGDTIPVNTVNYLSGGTPFGNGAIVSSNLTPDGAGRPGGMSYEQFRSAMHDGVSSTNSSHILQAMPWPIFRSMYENEYRAIYQYLSSIPSAPSGQGQCTAPGQAR